MDAVPNPAEPIRDALRAELAPMFGELRAFVDRRIAELSAELHASVEISDMGEAKLSAQIASIHERIAHLVAIPAASTRNSGVELEAVVQATERAADRILEAAEAIQDWVTRDAQDPAALQEISDRVNSIFEACSFQDVTGQRIRRAIQHLQQVEEMLEGLMPGLTAPIPTVQVPTALSTTGLPATATSDLAQDDIDALLNG